MNHFSCEGWNKGLNNTYIDNESRDYPCKINIPNNNTCFINEVGPYLDFSKLYRPTCGDPKLIISQIKYFQESIEKEKVLYYNLSDKKLFGYQLTNNNNYNYNICGTLVQKGKKVLDEELNKNIILMDLYLYNKSKYYPNETYPEVIVNISKDKANIIIKVQKNETLIKERKSIQDKSRNKKMFANILLFFIDTVSRAHFFRKFPKTIKFLNKFTEYERNYTKKNITIFEFLKYHSVNTYTNPNLKAAYFGAKFDGNGTHIANHFKNNGYIVGRSSTLCEKINIYTNDNINLNHVIWDHESISIPCIKGIYMSKLTNKLRSLIRRCLFGKEIFDYSLEYLESFWTTYKTENKMFIFDSGDEHEPTGQLIGYLDESLYNFFYRFYTKGWFKDTAIFLFSDHGQHLSGPFISFGSTDIKYEITLPFLFLILPNKDYLYEDNLYEIIKENQQIYITPFDLYDTLIQIAYDNITIYKNFSVPLGDSLFT